MSNCPGIRRQSRLALFTIVVGVAVAGFSPIPSWSASSDAEQAPEELLGDVERSVIEEQTERDQLDARAAKLNDDLLAIRQRLVEAASLVRQHETAMADLEERVADLEVLEREKSEILVRERADFGKVLYALERLARYPPEAMIAQPSNPSDTVRTAILLRALIPEIERRAARVRYEVESLARAREQAAERRAELEAERKALARESIALDQLMSEKRRLKSQTEAQRQAAEERLAMLRREARNIRELVAQLEKERKASEAEQKAEVESNASRTRTANVALTGELITSRQGRLPMPVTGVLASRYGDVNENGVTLRGIRIAARENAQVIAPHEGVAVYSGEFRGYGQLLIIEHGGGYHTLLAGMARIDTDMGQNVLSGEPVGVMGAGDEGRPVLYVELRRSGRPINPLPWIAARGTSPQG
ncbi:MAG: peptidoglycan DD-metalloendopeptidase family protein [Rhodospirillales bacterium]